MASEELKRLVKSLQKGNIEVFDKIYYLTKDTVFYTILSVMKDTSISEDLMQETYLKALDKIHTYKPKASFTAWIATIARNLAFNEFNRRKKELRIDPTNNEIIFGTVESNSENELIVKELLERLNETEREIVILHVIGDVKHKDISKMLGIPIGTVTWKYNEAIKKLKIEIDSESR